MIKNFIPASVLSGINKLKKYTDSIRKNTLKDGWKGTSGMTEKDENASGGYGDQPFQLFGRESRFSSEEESKGRRL